MTINLQTLKCAECGSGLLKRTAPNQYTCAHCGAISLVEDKVSERLDQVLDQVKNEAARRLAAEESQRRGGQRHAKVVGIIVAGLVVTGFVTLVVMKQAFKNVGGRSEPAVAHSVASDRSIAPEGLKLDAPREVLVGSGSSARAKLLVIAHNETGKPLERASVKAQFFDAGNQPLGERSETLPIGVLAPGEAAPVLIELPTKAVARHELQVSRLVTPFRTIAGPALTLTRPRLVQQRDEVRLVGQIVNPGKDVTLAGCELLLTLYDANGTVIGLGRGYMQGSELRPGARSTIEVRAERFGGNSAVAAWDYRINHQQLDPAQGRVQVVSPERVVRVAGAPEPFNPELRITADDLLASEAERFDPAQLELLPLQAGRSTTQDVVYLTELVNRSKDAIVIAPDAVITRFDGSQLDGAARLGGPAYLYPGERFPVLIEPREANRITQTRVEWKPLRRAAMPGPRVPLEVAVSGTRAQTSSVLVNFSRRFSYKYAEVQGSVKNPGTRVVRKPVLWVSLRDREGRLTGFTRFDQLPAIAPGESVPFQVKVDQHGRDFASVDTFYETD